MYIGQTDNFYRRLNQQVLGKDYWNTAIVFTGELDIDVQYLERICTKAAEQTLRYEIKNATGAPGRNISDFQRVVNDKFFENIKFVTALLGYPIFQETPKEQQARELYYLEDVNNKDASAKGALLPSGEFIVFANSKARISETASFKGSGPRLRRKLIEENVFQKLDDKSYLFSRDHIFTSPSAAGDAVSGRSTNGWTGWKNKEGKTLDDKVRAK